MAKSISKLKTTRDEVKCRETKKALKVLKGMNKRPGVYKGREGHWLIRIHYKSDEGSIYFDYNAKSRTIRNASDNNRRSAWTQVDNHEDIIEYMDRTASNAEWATIKQINFIKMLCRELDIEVDEEVFKDKSASTQEIERLLKIKDNPEEREPLDDYFGGCPYCGGVTAIKNVGRQHFGYCDKHETCWHIGSNLLSNWREETQEDWDANEEYLKSLKCVERIIYKDQIKQPCLTDTEQPQPVYLSDTLREIENKET